MTNETMWKFYKEVRIHSSKFYALKIEKNKHLQGVIHPTYMKYLSMDGLHSPQIDYLQRESLQPTLIQYLLFKSLCLYLHQNK